MPQQPALYRKNSTMNSFVVLTCAVCIIRSFLRSSTTPPESMLFTRRIFSSIDAISSELFQPSQVSVWHWNRLKHDQFMVSLCLVISLSQKHHVESHTSRWAESPQFHELQIACISRHCWANSKHTRTHTQAERHAEVQQRQHGHLWISLKSAGTSGLKCGCFSRSRSLSIRHYSSKVFMILHVCLRRLRPSHNLLSPQRAVGRRLPIPGASGSRASQTSSVKQFNKANAT